MSAAAYRKMVKPRDPGSKPRRQQPEAELQAAMIELSGLILRPEVLIFAVPNERTSVVERAKLRRMGVMPGVADLVVVGQLDGWTASVAFLEVKTATGHQSKPQKKFERRCQRIGAPYAVVRSVDEFQTQLEKWGLTK